MLQSKTNTSTMERLTRIYRMFVEQIDIEIINENFKTGRLELRLIEELPAGVFPAAIVHAAMAVEFAVEQDWGFLTGHEVFHVEHDLGIRVKNEDGAPVGPDQVIPRGLRIIFTYYVDLGILLEDRPDFFEDELGMTASSSKVAALVTIHTSALRGMVEKYFDRFKEAIDLSGMTKREMEIAALVAEGFKTSDIARRLGIGMKTVEQHKTRLMAKYDLRSIVDITKFAIKNGLINF